MRTGTHECFAVSITTAFADGVSETGIGRVPLSVPSFSHPGFSKAGSTCSGVAYVDVGTLLRGREGKVITRVEFGIAVFPVGRGWSLGDEEHQHQGNRGRRDAGGSGDVCLVGPGFVRFPAVDTPSAPICYWGYW